MQIIKNTVFELRAVHIEFEPSQLKEKIYRAIGPKIMQFHKISLNKNYKATQSTGRIFRWIKVMNFHTDNCWDKEKGGDVNRSKTHDPHRD